MQISVWKLKKWSTLKTAYNGAPELSREFIQIAMLLLIMHIPFVKDLNFVFVSVFLIL